MTFKKGDILIQIKDVGNECPIVKVSNILGNIYHCHWLPELRKFGNNTNTCNKESFRIPKRDELIKYKYEVKITDWEKEINS